MNSAFWRARPNQRDGCNDHQTLRRFVHCPLYGVYRCGLDWHCVDIALSLIETMTVAFGSIRYYRTQNNRSTSASIASFQTSDTPAQLSSLSHDGFVLFDGSTSNEWPDLVHRLPSKKAAVLLTIVACLGLARFSCGFCRCKQACAPNLLMPRILFSTSRLSYFEGRLGPWRRVLCASEYHPGHLSHK